jgi:poly(3-hydroxybutyrate) depolymerase
MVRTARAILLPSLLIIAGSCALAFGQDAGLPPGQVIEKITCHANPAESYALYLPSNYTPARKWPILYAFDPMARGMVPVEKFKDLAEKYGYILVASNNSRNGPWSVSVRAAQAMWQDTHVRFWLAPRRSYATGFSGGARVACALGRMAPGEVAGVIGMGAGFPLGTGQGPSADLPFIYYGTVGIRDFNYPELMQLDKTLTDLNIVHRVEVYDAGHDWPPPEVFAAVIEWMELHAMKAGSREKDETRVTEWFIHRLEEARELRAAGNLAEAFKRFQWLSADFESLHDIAEVKAEISQLEGSKELKKALKRENQRQERIQAMVDAAYGEFNQALGPLQEHGGDLWQIREALHGLRLPNRLKLAKEQQDKDEGIAAERFVRAVLVHAYEEAVEALARKDYAKARLNWMIASECAPESGQIHYMLARAHALNKANKDALAELRTAIEKGFTNREELEKNPDFDGLQQTPEFAKLLDQIKKP